MEDLAKAVDLTPSYLSTLFHKETGVSISSYVTGKRMEEARRLLRYTELSSAQISQRLAYSSQSHFIRVFREENGCTPREYRDRCAAQALRVEKQKSE